MDIGLLLDQYAFQRRYLRALVDDIPDGRMAEQPGGMTNHPAWQLGHLAQTTDSVVPLAGGVSVLDESWARRFARGTTPVPVRREYPSRDELVRVLEDRRAALADAVRRLTPERLAGPHPVERVRADLPTLGHVVSFFLLGHENTHLGQLAVWRKLAGLPPALPRLQQQSPADRR